MQFAEQWRVEPHVLLDIDFLLTILSRYYRQNADFSQPGPPNLVWTSLTDSSGVQLWYPGRAVVCIALPNIGLVKRRGSDGFQLWQRRVAMPGAMETVGEEV